GSLMTVEEVANADFTSILGTMLKSPQEGVNTCAKRLVRVIQAMVETMEEPKPNILRLDYEKLAGSSFGFEEEMTKLMDFFFEDTTSLAERHEAMEIARKHDPSRFANPEHEACESKAAALMTNATLAPMYRDWQKRLGYVVSI
ncbi:unnamed protein product, partial [Effrenium voratum]